MPDVGVLNLQIRDNSMQAAQGLSRLANVLKSIKASTTGLRLATVATGISKIQQSVAKINNSDLQKLKILTEEIQKLQAAAGGVNGIRISFGSTKAGGSASSGAMEQAQGIRDMAQDASNAMEHVGQRIQQDNEQAERFASTMERVQTIIQNTGWTAQATAEQFAQMFQTWNAMRQSSSIGPGGGYGLPESGFIYGEGTVSDSVEPLRLMAGAIDEVKDATQEATAAKEEFARPEGWGTGSIEELVTHSGELGERLRGVYGYVERIKAIKEVVEGTGIPKTEVMRQLSEIEQRGRKATEEIRNMMTALNQNPMSGMNLSRGIDRMMGIGAEPKSAKDSVAVFASLFDEEEKASAATEGLKLKLHELADALGISGKSFTEVMFGAEGLRGAMSRMFPTISGLLGRFKQLVKYRMLRAIIKQISEGFREGYENYYHYSEAIGSSFAPSMDSAASSLLQMKNSIGAAVAPLMQSLVPVLQTVVNWFITAVNWANQFIALLRGQSTWSKAVPTTTKAFEKTGKAAKSASSAMKDLLADWDELNIIQSQGGGGSGSAATGDYLKDYKSMFEEVGEYNEDIKRLVKGLKQQFGSILDFVTEIGTAILGWKISEAFGGIIGTLGGIVATGAIIDLVFKASTIFNGNYMQTGKTGWLVADMLTTFLGAVLARRALRNVLGGSLVNLAIPLTLTFSAIAGIKSIIGDVNTDALSKETIVAGIENSLKAGGAAGYLLFRFGNVGFLRSVGAGFGTTVTTLGVIVGLKAIANTIDTGRINEKTIKANLLSAGLIGGGLALTEAALGGTIATIAGVGIGGAVLTLGALFGIEAILVLSKDNPVHWGKRSLTEDQIRQFVENDAFTVNVPATVELIKQHIDTSKINRGEIEQTLGNMLGTMEVIRLGLANDDDYASLNSDVDALIKHVDDYVAEAKKTGKMSLTYTPTFAGGETGDASEWYKSYTTGWDKVNAYVRDKGTQIGAILSSAEREKIMAEEPELLSTLMNQMNNVTNAIARAKTNADALSGFEISANEAISKKSFEDLANAFLDYRTNLREGYTTLAMEQIAKQSELAAALFEIDPDGKEYKEAKDTLDWMVENLVSSIDTDVDAASKSGADRITELLMGVIGEVPQRMESRFRKGESDINYFDELLGENGTMKGMDKAEQLKEIKEWAYGFIMDADEEIGKAIKESGINPFAFMTKDMNKSIREYLGDYFTEEDINGLIPEVDYDVEYDDSGITEPTPVPAPDLSAYTSGLNDMMRRTSEAVNYVLSEMNRVNGLGFDISVHAPSNNGGGFSGGMKYYQRAEGGFVRSGDLVMANENGQFEMMGKFGHQPAVANNEQIVTGISRGVSVANDGVVSALNVLIGLAQRIERKELVAKVVPGTGIGRVNQQSADMFSRVTGV